MKKAFLIIGGVLVFILLALVILPYLFRGTIETKIKETVNTTINAKVDWKSLDLSLIKNFPNLQVKLDGLNVLNNAPFQGDTLVNFNQLVLVVDVMSVIDGKEIVVKAVIVNQPKIFAKVNKEGKANWDIVIPSADTAKVASAAVDSTAAPLKVKLDKISIVDGVVGYNDATMNLTTLLKGFNMNMKGNMHADVTDITFDAAVDMTVVMDSATYFNNTHFTVSSVLAADLGKMVFTFKNGLLTINKLPLTVEGSFGMPVAGYDLDMKISALKSDFKTFLGIVPAAYLKDLEKIKTSGDMSLDVIMKGRYVDNDHLPAFSLGLKVTDATLKYPDLPKSLSDINIDLNIANPGTNLDATTVDLKRFHFAMASNPFDFNAKVVTPISNATFKAEVKGIIDLGSLKDVMPMDSFDIAGVINADISVAGDNKMVEQKLYDQIDAKGDVKLKSFTFKSKALPQGVTIEEAQLKFTPKDLQLISFKSVIGKSDFSLTGSIQNYLGYALKNEVLVGVLNHSSTLIDANEFLTGAPTTPTTTTPVDTSKIEPVVIPRNIDFTLNTSIGKIYYDKLTINDTKGQVIIRDGVAKMNNLKMNMLEGVVVMNGTFNTQNPNKPAVDFGVDATNINIKQASNSFAVVDSLAPIAKQMDGFMAAKFDIDLFMGKDLSPIMKSINGKGTMKSKEVNLKGAKFQKNLVTVLNDSKYEEFKIQDFTLVFTIKDGNVILDPFVAKVFGKNFTISGTTSVEQKIDYKINMPISRAEINKLVGVAGISMSTEGADIPVDLLIGGTMTSPTYKIDTKEYKKQLANQATDAAKKEATKILNDVVADPSKAKETITKSADDAKKLLKGMFK